MRRLGRLVLLASSLVACKFPPPEDVADDAQTSPTDAASADGAIDAPVLAPMIAFVSDRTGNNDIFTMRIDGSELTNLTNDPATDEAPLWSPTGDHIGFLSSRGGTIELYVMQSDGTQVTNVSHGHATRFDWSPDGVHLAFGSRRNGTDEIFVANVNGSAPLAVPGISGVEPRWSPTEQRLAFSASTGIFTVNSDGTGLQRVTMGTDSSPAWSPDGRQIAFSHRVTFVNNDVFLIGVEGANAVNLTHSTDTTEYRPLWSPDGHFLAVVGGTDTNSEIYVVSADGSQMTNVSMTANYDGDQRWSHDGGTIAFSSAGEILLVPRVGGLVANLTQHPAADASPSWRP